MGSCGGIDAGFAVGARSRGGTHGDATAMMARRVLILEDSLIIAMEAEEILHEMGAEVVEIAATIEQAVSALHTFAFDFALLDVNLGEAMSFGFARLLAERGIPFGFVSGYSDTMDFPPDMQEVALLVKPFDEAAMQQFLEKVFGLS